MKKFLAIFVILATGCGYAPLKNFTQNAIADKIFVELIVNPAVPENNTLVKNELNKMIFTRLKKQIVAKDEAEAIIRAQISEVRESSIATDSAGLTTFYRVHVWLNLSYEAKNSLTKNFTNSAYADYAAASDVLSTSKNRIRAIETAILDCVNRFLSQIALGGEFDS